jgi:hypothetical protein
MNLIASSPFPGSAGCSIRGHAVVASRLSSLAALRDAAVPPGCPALPPRFLRQSDEHTVVAVRAVLEAMAGLPEPMNFDRCGVIAAPCQAGRIAAARSLTQLQAGGAGGVSPHIVPQCSLHSLGDAVSVALGMHGPHIGVGGGPDALAEGLFAAVSLFQGGTGSGCDLAWLVVTDWDTEPLLDAAGMPTNDPSCRALAMLLAPADPADDDRLSLSLHMPTAAVGAALPADPPAGGLAAFCRAVEMCATGSVLTSWAVSCPWGAEIRLVVREQVEGLMLHRIPAAVRRRREAA